MSGPKGGLDVTTGATASKAGLAKHRAQRIGIVTLYQPVGDAQVRACMTEMGYGANSVHGLRCLTAFSFAQVQPETLKDTFRK